MSQFPGRTQLPRLIERAGDELDRHEYNERDNHKIYNELQEHAANSGLAARQAISEAVYLSRHARLRSSRLFDTCFEMGDGDQVVTYLVEQSRSNPTLHAAIAEDFRGIFPEKWLATAAKTTAQRTLL